MFEYFAKVLVTIIILVLSVTGGVFLIGGSINLAVINDCKEFGWHNFGQTRIICSVEPKKEAK